MKKPNDNSCEEMESSYQYLFDKIVKEKRKDLAVFVLSFREQLLKERKLRSYSDLVALDILYAHACSNADEPWKGREAANEAYKVLKGRTTSFEKEEALTAYLTLAEVFDYLEDIDKQRLCYAEASFFGFLLKDKEKAVMAKEKEIHLVFRYPEEERVALFPTYESLVMQFGQEEGKRLFDLEIVEPSIHHDPIESNPLFTKIIDEINIALKEHFDKHPEEFSLENHISMKSRLLNERGVEWKAPY